jgi:hypothetical protein
MNTKLAAIISTITAMPIGMARVSPSVLTPPGLRYSTILPAWNICHPTS